MDNILCLGKFDVLHIGHMHHLKEAKKLGGTLVVAITADKYVTEPLVFNEQQRKEALDLLEWVDIVYICNAKNGIPAIKKYKPKYFIKGVDYKHALDPTLKKEIDEVEKYGGQLKIVDAKIQFSSTKIKHDHSQFNYLQDSQILSTVNNFIEQSKKINVQVIGEDIKDIFVPVEMQGQSMKSRCPTFKLNGKQQVQTGGAHIVHKHLKNFCNKSVFVTNTSCITKIRYIDTSLNKKHFEVVATTVDALKTSIHKYDGLNLICDFGHGLFDSSLLFDGAYTMVQTNSSNFGYNLATKWNQYKHTLICIDKMEASLILNKRISSTFPPSLLPTLYKKLNTKKLIVTLHKNGSIYYDGNQIVSFPALAKTTIDTIGAGDAFFSFASLADYLKFSPKDVLLIGSIAAAINTQWVCNAYAITPQRMTRAAKIIM